MSERWWWRLPPLRVIYALLFALTAIPVLTVGLPPLVDYPNHLARMALLASGDQDPILAGIYRAHWVPLPNLAMDVLVPPLVPLVGLAAAGRLFILLIFALLTAGTILLHRALHPARHGRWSLWPLASFLLLYNGTLLWGFLNFLFGLGLALVALALAAGLRDRPWRDRAAALTPFALLIWFSHIVAFGFFALALFGLAGTRLRRAMVARDYRGLLATGAAVGIPLVLPLAVMIHEWQPTAGGGAIVWGHWWRKLDLPFGVFNNYDRIFDVVGFAAAVGVLIALALGRRLPLAPGAGGMLAWPTAAYLVMPAELMTGTGADHRLPLGLFLLLIAGTAPAWPGRWGRWVALAGCGLLVARLAVIERDWRQADRLYDRALGLLAALPDGVRLAVAYPDTLVHPGAAPLIHLPTLVVPFRSGFVPTLFAYPAQQPIELLPPYNLLAAAARPDRLWRALVDQDPAAAGDLAAVLPVLDALVVIGDWPGRTRPDRCLVPLVAGVPDPIPGFTLRRIDHDQCGAGPTGGAGPDSPGPDSPR